MQYLQPWQLCSRDADSEWEAELTSTFEHFRHRSLTFQSMQGGFGVEKSTL
jgi:hypothetical protein